MSLDSLFFAYLSPMCFMFVMTVDDTPLSLACISSVIRPYLSSSHFYHILNLTLNLISIGQLYDSGYSFFFFYFLFYVESLISEVNWDRL